MAYATSKRTNEVTFVIALRHLGVEREILVVKAKGRDFFAFLPAGKAGLSDIEIHSAYHKSGERHMVARRFDGDEWREDKWPRHGHGAEETMRRQTTVERPPVDALRGAELFFGCNIFHEQFSELEHIGTNVGEVVVLDATSDNFRDDFTAVRVYLVEANREDTIPLNEYAGPRILHVIERTNPWIALEVFQQQAV